jgi:hypothetical protein
MHFASNDGTFQLELPSEVARYIRLQSTLAKANETGGILIGRYSANLSLAIVSRATAPPADSRAGATWFERGTTGIEKLLTEVWSKGLHYLGEWHYHPRGAPFASSKDEAQMRRIAADELTRCNAPILLILGEIGGRPEIGVYVEANGYLVRLDVAFRRKDRRQSYASR